MTIDGINVTCSGFVPFKGEIERYVAKFKHDLPDLVSLHFEATPDGGIDVSYTQHHTPFERIRRVTGYLVGSLERWNDAKQAEERDRVKHDPRV